MPASPETGRLKLTLHEAVELAKLVLIQLTVAANRIARIVHSFAEGIVLCQRKYLPKAALVFIFVKAHIRS